MSRCFPFPPSGYEKKLNLDDANLLAKAKHKEKKEKKHKKEKKDKEKKEGKEKDKDRSKKKEKKEKHRDKNPEKNNPGDEKRIEGHPGSVLQSNHLAESSHVQELARRIKDDDNATGRKIVDRNIVTIQKQGEPFRKVAAINATNQSDRKEAPNDKNTSKNHVSEHTDNIETKVRRVAIVHSLGGMEQKGVDAVKPTEKDAAKAAEWKEKDKPHVSGSKGDKINDRDDRKVNRQVEQFNGNNFISNTVQNRQIRENGFVQDFEGKIRDGYAAPKGQFVDKNIEMDQKRAGDMGQKNAEINQKREHVGRMAESSTSPFSEGKALSNNGNGFYSKVSGQSDKSRGPKVSFVHNLSRGAEQKKLEGLGPMEKGIKRSADGKEKVKQEDRDTAADKDLDGVYMSIGGDKSTEKTVVNRREGGEPIKKIFRIKEVVRDTGDGSKSGIFKDFNKVSAPEGNAKKRKQPELNGFLHDNEIRPSKLQRPASASRSPFENGRKLDVASSLGPLSTPKEKGPALHHKIQVKKEHKLNGVTDLLQSTVNSTMSPSQNHRSPAICIASVSALKEKDKATVHKVETETKINGFLDQCQPTVNLPILSSVAPKAKKRHKAPSVRPPHPDSKYLSEILSIPKMDDMVEPDDLDWLFNADNRSEKKALKCSFEPETQHVWDKALRIESADVSILPYVIPY